MSDTEATEQPGTTPQDAPGPVTKVDEHEGGTGHGHPTEKEYIKVAVFLAVITLAEVIVYGIEALEGVLPYILVTMSAIKFFAVVFWFMHLRFDSRLFRRLFVTGLVLAVIVYGIALTTMRAWTAGR